MFGASALIGLLAALNLVSSSSTAEFLSETWSYTYSYVSSDYMETQEFPGIADAEGNLYSLLCRWYGRSGYFRQRDCSIRSTDFDGNRRYELLLGSGWIPDWTFVLHLVAGSVVLAEHNAMLTAFDTLSGSVRWTRNLEEEFPVWPPPVIGGIAYDGRGRLIVLTRTSVDALSATTGETIWRRVLTSDDPRREVWLQTVVLDESDNAYFAKDLCPPYPSSDCDSSIVSVDPEGAQRFAIDVDFHARPLAVAHGRLLVGPFWWARGPRSEVLDVETGAPVAKLPGDLFDRMGLISTELGFFLQEAPRGEFALAAFDLASGAVRWRYPPNSFAQSAVAALLTDAGNVLLAYKTSLLEISPEGELVRQIFLRTPHGLDGIGGSLLLKGRWFAQVGGTVFAFDLPGAPPEACLGWNSRYGDSQGGRRPRENCY